MPQTAKQEWCRETGRMKNCGTFAEYEGGNSGEAAMCNGGIYDGDTYDSCPSREPCRQATVQLRPKHAPAPERNYGTQVVGRTATASPPQTGWRQVDNMINQSVQSTRWASPATTLPAAKPGGAAPGAQPGMVSYNGVPYPAYVPTPVQPPPQFPPAMQTPFAAPIPFHAGGVSPTFLPEQGGGVFKRLGKNIGQGLIASTGWHVFDFARNVDMFGRRK